MLSDYELAQLRRHNELLTAEKERDQLRVELEEAKEKCGNMAKASHQREGVTQRKIEAARADNEALTKRLDEARGLIETARDEIGRAISPDKWTRLFLGRCCAFLASGSSTPREPEEARRETRDLDICARPKCESPRHYNIHDPERGGHVFVEASGSSTREAPSWCANQDHSSAPHTNNGGCEPAAPEPAPAPLCRCPTDECRMAEGANESVYGGRCRDREPAPASAQGTTGDLAETDMRKQLQEASRLIGKLSLSVDSHHSRLKNTAEELDALDKRVAAHMEKFDALWEACRTNGLPGIAYWKPEPPQPAPVERHAFYCTVGKDGKGGDCGHAACPCDRYGCGGQPRSAAIHGEGGK